MLTIDGSLGEGGGQMLRTSLSLSLLTGQPFQMHNIRARRSNPGLQRQHLAAVRAAMEISQATVEGDALKSTSLLFRPRKVTAGDFTFALGGAGSTVLVFQTVLLPLLLRGESPSRLTFRGGTDNPMAPPFDFLEGAFLPVLKSMGAGIELRLEQRGFYPAGGGEWTATIQPVKQLARFEVPARGQLLSTNLKAVVANLPAEVAKRELARAAVLLDLSPDNDTFEVLRRAPGPGNVFSVTMQSVHVTEIFSSFGERGLPAERVAEAAASEAARYLKAGVPVGEHLADQLLLPMALGHGGLFRTLRPSLHFRTQVEVIQRFLPCRIDSTAEAADCFRVEVEPTR